MTYEARRRISIGNERRRINNDNLSGQCRNGEILINRKTEEGNRRKVSTVKF